MTLYAIIGGIVAAIGGMILSFLMGSRSANRKRDADQSEASLDAELKRRKLDDEINADPDLVERARNSGLLRDDAE